MVENNPVLLPDRFVSGALRSRRKPQGSQKDVGARAGVCAGTISRAERGFGVNFTSAILLAVALGLLPYGTYDIRDPQIKRVLRYMRVVQRGRHAKGWDDYYSGIQRLLAKKAA